MGVIQSSINQLLGMGAVAGGIVKQTQKDGEKDTAQASTATKAKAVKKDYKQKEVMNDLKERSSRKIEQGRSLKELRMIMNGINPETGERPQQSLEETLKNLGVE